MNKEKYWEFSFDINQEALKEVYGRRSITYAYEEIKRFMFKNGFSDKNAKQGSCYFTESKMEYNRANIIINNLFDQLPWLSECIRKSSLYEKPEDSLDYDSYCFYLNKSEEHKLALERYYQELGIKMPLKLQMELSSRTHDLKNSKRTTYRNLDIDNEKN